MIAGSRLTRRVREEGSEYGREYGWTKGNQYDFNEKPSSSRTLVVIKFYWCQMFGAVGISSFVVRRFRFSYFVSSRSCLWSAGSPQGGIVSSYQNFGKTHKLTLV